MGFGGEVLPTYVYIYIHLDRYLGEYLDRCKTYLALYIYNHFGTDYTYLVDDLMGNVEGYVGVLLRVVGSPLRGAKAM